ncbi:enolase C-terminal domain-like protein [Mesorhizobium sp. B2-7-1]|uniref:enolase C-terminal domain-like protein n=1 Tax=Mesorhizobium sp. B2-7-1 TaxID=2589909 RepID=UPI002484CE96|nr:enolase C-terminal domain-like protein [Mesorhizobium sp. B2-7-1]
MAAGRQASSGRYYLHQDCQDGRILRSQKVAGMCEAAGIPCYAGAMWVSGIGLAASLHFACSSPAIKYGSDFYAADYLMTDDLVVSPLAVSDGAIFVPTGLGVEAELGGIGFGGLGIHGLIGVRAAKHAGEALSNAEACALSL